MTIIPINFTLRVSRSLQYSRVYNVLSFSSGSQPVYSSQSQIDTAQIGPASGTTYYTLYTTSKSFSTSQGWNTIEPEVQESSEGTFVFPRINCVKDGDTVYIKFSKLRNSFSIENMITDAEIVMDGDVPTLVLTRENVTMVKQ